MSSDTAVLQPSPGPTRTDKLFLGFLVLVLVGVATVGRMAYTQGQKNETTKKMPRPGFSGWRKQAQTGLKATLSPKAVPVAKMTTSRATPGPAA